MDYNIRSPKRHIRPQLENYELQSDQALTLLEVILVIALLAGVMVYAIPNILVEDDHSATFNALRAEIKSAYDSAVLSGFTHRIVFDLEKKTIFLERNTQIGDISHQILSSDIEHLSEQERDAAHQEKIASLKEIAKLAGDEVSDFEQNRTIPPTSPLIQAQQNLLGYSWDKVDDFGHTTIDLSGLSITRYRVEHLGEEIIHSDQAASIIYLYVFPQGYVEKAYFVWFEDYNDTIIEDRPPYIIATLPYQGVALLSTSLEDINPFLDTIQ